MKKYTWLVLFVCAFAFTACEGGCKKGADSAATTPTDEEVVVEEVVEISPEVTEKAAQVSTTLSAALCKRMTECAPGTLTEEDCVTQTTASLNEAQKTKPLDISDDALNACIASIGKGNCEEVLGTEPPAGCEFLK